MARRKAKADTHDSRATVTLGGRELELAATKRAEIIYGQRFRDDTDALGRSGAYVRREVEATDEDGNPAMTEVRDELAYTGRLKTDVAISQTAAVTPLGEIPYQTYAAAWAMARAAGSTDLSWDEFEVQLWDMPAVAAEDFALWEAVCVDLAERAFFRDVGGQDHAGQPDEGATE